MKIYVYYLSIPLPGRKGVESGGVCVHVASNRLHSHPKHRRRPSLVLRMLEPKPCLHLRIHAAVVVTAFDVAWWQSEAQGRQSWRNTLVFEFLGCVGCVPSTTWGVNVTSLGVLWHWTSIVVFFSSFYLVFLCFWQKIVLNIFTNSEWPDTESPYPIPVNTLTVINSLFSCVCVPPSCD